VRPRLTTCLVAALLCGGEAAGREQPSLDRALAAFLGASDAKAAASAIDAVVASGADVRDVYERLSAGRQYTPQAPGPTILRSAASDGTTIETEITLPDAYQPTRRWPVRVQLHGGVGRPPPGVGEAPRPLAPNRIQGEEAIYVQPRAHARAEWWHLNQFENMVSVLDRVKRTYNVDENLVYLTGVSDGATGAYFFAMKLPTPFSAFLPLNGNMRVLSSPGTRANGQLYAGNLVNKPLFIVNGGRDPLYPVSAVSPHVEMLRQAGATLEFRPQPTAGHDTSWWPAEREPFERFIRAHPRRPHPEFLSWETERTDRYNRVHWLVVDQLGRRPTDDGSLVDVNRFSAEGMDQRMFARTWPSGRVDVRRSGNVFEARSRGVAAFTLLLSPAVVDFSRPVVVSVNGQEAFSGVVRQDLRCLLEWAAADADRTLLYTAELPIRVP
jgi:predicted esterase